MNFLAMTLGSIGDFFPFLAVAQRLRAQGHRVVLASNASYAALAQMAGFEFSAIWHRSGQALDGMITQDPTRAWSVVREEMFQPAIGPARDCIAHYTREGRWALLASWSVLAASKAHDTAGLPLCRVYLSPGGMASDDDWRADDSGLRSVSLFPSWFAATHIAQTGFVTLDDAEIPQLSGELEAFLRAGPKPVIFTPGSFMRDAGTFFREALAACDRLDLRALFLTPYREQVPKELPLYARHFSYAPLQRLAPRAAALVHHGGIGTLAQGLKAGIPQLVTPLFFDQPDNAERLEALGVSATLAPQVWRSDAVAQKLGEILQSDVIRQNCIRATAHFGEQDVVKQTCDIALSVGQ